MTVIKEWEKREALSGAWTTLLPTLKPPSSTGYRSRISCSFPRLIQSSHQRQTWTGGSVNEIKTTLSAITVLLLFTLSRILGQLGCGLFWWYAYHTDWAETWPVSFFIKVHFQTIPFTPSVLTMLTEVHDDWKQLKAITLVKREQYINSGKDNKVPCNKINQWPRHTKPVQRTHDSNSKWR